MKKSLLIILICFFANISLVKADELICEYKYDVYMNSGKEGMEVIDAMGEQTICVGDGILQGITFGLYNPDWCKGGSATSYVETSKAIPITITVKVKPNLVGTNPKFVVSFSDACDPNKATCSKTKTIEGSSKSEFDNKNLHINEGFFDDLTKSGECPKEGYIDLYNLKSWTPGYNELCFKNLSKCEQENNEAFKFENFGYDRWIQESSMKVTNKLDGKAREIETILKNDTFSTKWPLNQNTCTTLYQSAIEASDSNYEKVKQEKASEYAKEVLVLTETTIKQKYPAGGEGLWRVLNNRINYLSLSGGANAPEVPYNIANNHLNKVAAYCKGEIDADETMTEEEKEQAKERIDEQTGEDKAQAKKQYVENFNLYIGADYSGDNSCEGYLGDPNSSGTPAYYLQIAFNIMKYLGVIFALVFSVVDFVKATVSQDKALLTKAVSTSVKRLIFAIVIFFLPIVINFILGLIGAYSTCVS